MLQFQDILLGVKLNLALSNGYKLKWFSAVLSEFQVNCWFERKLSSLVWSNKITSEISNVFTYLTVATHYTDLFAHTNKHNLLTLL